MTNFQPDLPTMDAFSRGQSPTHLYHPWHVVDNISDRASDRDNKVDLGFAMLVWGDLHGFTNRKFQAQLMQRKLHESTV